uniref:Uncharacterized protein n=1 Tax=Rhizophora mucronata TaxID=61149 RepID=A0A2P2Q6D4_RHIMU
MAQWLRASFGRRQKHLCHSAEVNPRRIHCLFLHQNSMVNYSKSVSSF